MAVSLRSVGAACCAATDERASELAAPVSPSHPVTLVLAFTGCCKPRWRRCRRSTGWSCRRGSCRVCTCSVSMSDRSRSGCNSGGNCRLSDRFGVHTAGRSPDRPRTKRRKHGRSPTRAGQTTRPRPRRFPAAASVIETAMRKMRKALLVWARFRAPLIDAQDPARGKRFLVCVVCTLLILQRRWRRWRAFTSPLRIAEPGAAIGAAAAREPGGATADRSSPGLSLLTNRSRQATDVDSRVAGHRQRDAVFGTEAENALAVAALAGVQAGETVGTTRAAELAATWSRMATAAPEARPSAGFLAAATGHRDALLGTQLRRAAPH